MQHLRYALDCDVNLNRDHQAAGSIARCVRITCAIALIFEISTTDMNAAPALAFVGCISYGQAARVAAPQSVIVNRLLRVDDARNLAYYKSAEIGLVAPKGWNCEGYSDSSGWGMFLSPKPIHGEPRWPNFKGPAIDVHHISGENGFGHSQIADGVARVFPAFRTWAVRSMEGFDVRLPGGPYASDRLTYRSSRIVEFETPPRRKGLGNDFSRIVPDEKPTFGVAILMGNPPQHLLVMSIRLPKELRHLLPLILKDIEEHRGEN